MYNADLARPGDSIVAMGHSFTIGTILFQDYFGPRSSRSDCWGYDIEFLDTAGAYHHWKQNLDGGDVVRSGQDADGSETYRNEAGHTAVIAPRKAGTWSVTVCTSPIESEISEGTKRMRGPFLS